MIAAPAETKISPEFAWLWVVESACTSIPLTVINPIVEPDCPAIIPTEPPCATPPVAEAVIDEMLIKPDIATA